MSASYLVTPSLDQPPLSLRLRDALCVSLGGDLVHWVQQRLVRDGDEWRLEHQDPAAFRPLVEDAAEICGYDPLQIWCFFLAAWHYDDKRFNGCYVPVVWRLVSESGWRPPVPDSVPNVAACELLCAVAATLQDLSAWGQFFIPPKEAQRLLLGEGIELPLRAVNKCYRALEDAGIWERVLGGPTAGYCWYVYRGMGD